MQQSAQILLQDKVRNGLQLSLTRNTLDLSRFCYHTFVISQTLWLSCQQSYRFKYVKYQNPQVFYSHCCPKHCDPKLRKVARTSSNSMFGPTVSHLFIWRKGGSWIHYFIGTGSAPLGTYRLIRPQQALNKDLNSHEAVDVSAPNTHDHTCSDIAGALVWGEQSFPNLEWTIQL